MRCVLVCALLSACDTNAARPSDLASAPDMTAICTDTHEGVCPVIVNGKVVNESGMPLDALTVSVCADGCFFGTTIADGTFTVVPDQHIILANYALELHGRPDRASYYTPLPPANGMTLDFPLPLPLPLMPASGPEILGDMSAQSLTSGDLTITVAAGTKVAFDVEDFGVAHGHDLRVQKVPLPLPFIDGTPDAVYAISPFETGFDQKIALSFANSSNIPAGSAVEIQSMHGLINDVPPAGHMFHAATAHVSADGKTITTDPGEGVTELTWLTLKRM